VDFTKRAEKKLSSLLPHTNNWGQAVLEFALVLPMLLLLIVGALEFGRVYFVKIVLTNAAREGAYYLSFNMDDSQNCSGSGVDKICFLETRQAVMDEANNSGVTLTNEDISIATPCCTPGQTVTVGAGTTVNNLILIGLLGNGFTTDATKDSIDLAVSVQMVAQ
jgi:Flp pilus assembly protein TadG